MAKTSSIAGIGFFREAKAELKKVTWPSRQQIGSWTMIVIAFTLGVAVYLGLIDFILAWGFTKLLG